MAKTLRHLGIAAVLITATACAQIDTGAIVGTVRDPSGSAIPGTKLTVTNNATGVAFSVTSNSSGQYQFTAVKVGTYSVRAAAQGFTTQVVNNIQIDVQSRPSIDFSLKIGDAAQTVEVQSAAPLLNTQTADVGGVVQQQQIRDLPLNGRRYADLALLEPGIQKDPTVANAAPDRFSSNGNLETQKLFLARWYREQLRLHQSARGFRSDRAAAARCIGGIFAFRRALIRRSLAPRRAQ